MRRADPPPEAAPGEPLSRLRALVDELTGSEQAAVLEFLSDPSARRIALAASVPEQAQALNGWLNEQELAGPPASVGTAGLSRTVRAGRSVPLPRAPAPDQVSLVGAITTRRSRYAYSARPIRLADLGALLLHSVGVGRRISAYGRPDYPLSLAPSAGGLNSIVVYAIVSRAEVVSPGLYRYEPEQHALAELALGDPRPALARVYGQPEFAAQSAITLVLAARLTHTLQKYSLRHYRALHIDTGIAAQNLCLVATALHLACCAVSGYRDTEVTHLLELGDHQIPTLLIPLGHRPTPHP